MHFIVTVLNYYHDFESPTLQSILQFTKPVSIVIPLNPMVILWYSQGKVFTFLLEMVTHSSKTLNYSRLKQPVRHRGRGLILGSPDGSPRFHLGTRVHTSLLSSSLLTSDVKSATGRYIRDTTNGDSLVNRLADQFVLSKQNQTNSKMSLLLCCVQTSPQ